MRFYEYEGVFPILDSSLEFIQRFGIPHSVYLDRHSTYKTTRQPSVDEQLQDSHPLTQFERIMKQIGVIHARSPQAKGHVERVFQTLQDRLVKEMRLHAIQTISEANAFLESYLVSYNKMFSVAPKDEIVQKKFRLPWI
ncbi:MAG: integrase core domain-containing protein [bacterium]